MKWFLAFAISTVAVAAQAQDDLVFSTEITESCLAEAGGLPAAESCIGKAAIACMEATEGGTSTFGQNACLDAELFYWDGRFNAAFASVLEHAEAYDEEMQTEENGLLTLAGALRTSNDAWSSYVDVSCEYEMAKYAGGSGAGPANLRCQVTHIARQALWLEQEANSY
jgi:uncharacterized protein YecT (DUF1311 family)